MVAGPVSRSLALLVSGDSECAKSNSSNCLLLFDFTRQYNEREAMGYIILRINCSQTKKGIGFKRQARWGH